MQDTVEQDAVTTDSSKQPPATERRKVTRRAVGSNAVVGRRDSKPEEPTLELKRRDGVVESILVTCSCGKKIEIACDFSEQSP